MALTRGNTTKRRRSKNSRLRKFAPTCKLPGGDVLRKLSAEDVQRLRRRVVEPIECVYDDSFRSRNAAKEIMGVDEAQIRRNLVGRDNVHGRRTHKTLTLEQERALFLKLNLARHRMMRLLKQFAGRRITLTAARELLEWDAMASHVRATIVEANLGLVPTMIERSRIKGVDFGELISEGQLALLRSVDKFDCARGFKFSTYACRAIITSITRAVAMMARHRSYFPTEYDPDMQRGDMTETRRAGVEEDCIEALQGILHRNDAELTPTERKILSERFGFGRATATHAIAPEKTLRQVADLFGVTKERVRQIQNRALSKLRGAIDERVFV